MLMTQYLVLDQFEFVEEEPDGNTALFDKEEAGVVAKWLLNEGSKSVIIIPFKYMEEEYE